MKKFTILFAISLMVLSISFAQQAREGNYPFTKKVAPMAYGVSIELSATPDHAAEVISKAWKDQTKIKSKGFKDNLYVVEAASLPRITEATLDYYYRIEPASKKDKSNSRVTLFLSSGNFNFRDQKEHPEEYKAAKLWLEELGNKVNGKEMELAIAAQEAVIKDMQKEIEKLKKEQLDLDKKRQEILEAIEKNEGEQVAKEQKRLKEEEKLAKMQQTLRKIK